MQNENIYSNLEKDSEIKKEQSRIKRLFKNIDKNKLTIVNNLISTLAFINISLREVEKLINIEGYTDENNKQSDNIKTHIALTKNQATLIKQLCDLLPESTQKNARLDMFRKS